MNKKTRYMIRMDDITPDMDWDKFNRIKDIFEKYEICPLLGVVPDNKDAKLCVQEKKKDFWEILQELKSRGWTLAQHGTYHKYVTDESGILGLKKASEFAGLPYEEQLSKLQEGKRILEENGVFTDIFMAPGHTYDKNTIKALLNTGFHTVTDGLYFIPYSYEGLLFVPCRLQGYNNKRGFDTICLHANTMSDRAIEDLETFCKENRNEIVPFEPDGVRRYAVKRDLKVEIYEKGMLLLRKVKGRISDSRRLAWYMQYTNDTNSKKKWLKRVYCLPLLFFSRQER